MRKWLAFTIQVPFIAMVWAGCSGDDTSTDAGDAQVQDVKAEKKPVPETGPDDSGPVCPTPMSTIDTSQVKWVPPATPNATACSDVQIQSYYDSCFGANATTQTCQAFQTASANCYKCLLTPQTAPAYGALIAIGGVDYANTAGCVALLTGDTSASGCGAKSQFVTQCEDLACSANCPVTDNASFALYQQCTQAADGSVCKPYVDAECDLSDAGNVFATCLNHQDFESFYLAVAPVFCGGYPADAGTDAGSTDASTDATDDGATDASTDAPDGD